MSQSRCGMPRRISCRWTTMKAASGQKTDAMMLRAAAETARFGGCKMVLYRDQFAPEEETQFAAMTFLLPDDTAFVAFRGTDRSLVGWKEDFNMAFQEAVPAQLRTFSVPLLTAADTGVPSVTVMKPAWQ